MKTQEEWNSIWKQIIIDNTDRKDFEIKEVIFWDRTGNYRVTYQYYVDDKFYKYRYGILHIEPKTVEVYARKQKIEKIRSKMNVKHK